ncbi:MAG: response regulator [Gammaproteobacteria bacterium]
MTNAAKYTPKPDRIGLTIEAVGEEAVIRVRDYGIGIAREFLPRVFDLFVQVDSSLGRAQGRLGIGLTLVKQLVTMQHGSVTASSPGIGQGSEFVVRLPLSKQTPADVATAAKQVEPRVTDALRRRVLVVHDNVDAAESVSAILKLSGYSVRCEYDGRSALEAVESYHPDVVLLDIGLPDITGYDVAARLRANPRFSRIPLVAVTGYGQEADRRRSKEVGIDHHMTKPVDPEALQALIAASHSNG